MALNDLERIQFSMSE